MIPASLPLLLLPGLICDAGIFAAQHARFPQGVAWESYGERDRLEDMARDVLAAAPPRFALLGHSMGARIALEVLRAAPDRVDRIALVSTGTHDVRPGEAEKRHALLSLGRERGIEALVDAWLPPMVAPSRRGDAALMAPLRAMCVAQGVDAFATQITALLARPSLEALLPAIRCPTLLAVGAEDAWSPPEQHQAIADVVPHARLAVVAGAGHMLPAEAPDALNDLIAAWLTEPTTTAPKGEDA